MHIRDITRGNTIQGYCIQTYTSPTPCSRVSFHGRRDSNLPLSPSLAHTLTLSPSLQGSSAVVDCAHYLPATTVNRLP